MASATVTDVNSKVWTYDSSTGSITAPSGVTEIPAGLFAGKFFSTTKITIPSGIVTIGDQAFMNNYYCQGITIPSTVKTIGTNAFANMFKLAALTIPEGVTTIKDQAFSGCMDVLTTVNLPKSLTTLGDAVFAQCSALTSITVTSGSSYFSATDGILFNASKTELWLYPPAKTNTSYTIPTTVTTIKAAAFAFSTKLQTVTISSNVKKIEKWAFQNCTALTTCTIPTTVTTIEQAILCNCTALTSYTLPTTIGSVGGLGMLTGCTNLTSVTIPEGVKSLPEKIFQNCTALKKVNIPKSVTTMGNYVFIGCSSLLTAGPTGSGCNIEFAWDSIIPGFAFYYADCLTSITIPEGIVEIQGAAFTSCSKLKYVKIPSTLYMVGCLPDGYLYATFDDCPLLETAGPAGSGCNIEFASNATSIPVGIFSLSNITKVTIPDGVTDVGTYAFTYNNNLSKIIIPKSVISMTDSIIECPLITTAGPIGSGCNIEFGWDTAIPNSAFFDCTSLTKITLPDTLNSIGASAFQNCISLSKVIIPSSVTIMGTDIFNSCFNLFTAGPIGSGCNIEFGWNKRIPDYAFIHADCITSITIPETITEIGTQAFYNTGITTIIIPEKVTSIGAKVFSICSKLNKVIIPKSVTSIGWQCFYNSSKLLTAGPIGGDYNIEYGWDTEIPSDAFSESTKLVNITLPDTITKIGDNSFNGCSGLTTINIPEGLTEIGSKAFYNCSSLTHITIPGNVTVGNDAFYGCNLLEELTYNGTQKAYDLTFVNASVPTTTNIIYTILTLSITGNSGTNWIYDPDTGVLKPDDDNARFDIPDNEFEGNSDFENVIIDTTYVEVIGDYAFANCPNLTSIRTGPNFYTIGNHSFENCNKLTTVTFVNSSNSVETIGDYAFANCAELSSINLSESVKTIGEGAFNNSPKLKTLGPDNSYNISYFWHGGIPARAFLNNNTITTANINDIRSIGDEVFKGCTQLTKITLSATDLGENIFQGCNKLLTVGPIGSESNIEFDWDTYIPENAFWNSSITSIEFGSVNLVYQNAFRGCLGLRSITLPQGLPYVDTGTFYGCTNLEEVSIPSSVARIYDNAFRNCESLQNVILPERIEYIESHAFDGCRSLDIINIPEGLFYMGEYAFKDCVSLKKINIPYILQIGVGVIKGCVLLKTMGPSDDGRDYDVTYGWYGTLPSGGFVEYDSISKLVISRNLPLTQQIFDTCTDLRDITFIGTESDWDRMYSQYTIREDMNVLYTIFKDNKNNEWSYDEDTKILTAIGFSDIETDAFNGNERFTDVIIDPSCDTQRIGSRAFANCPNLTSVIIPDTVYSINSEVFANSPNLKKVVFLGEFETIDSGAFKDAPGLLTAGPVGEDYSIQVNFTGWIPTSVFRDANCITTIKISEGADYTSGDTFIGCTSLEKLILPKSLVRMNTDDLRNCPLLKTAGPIGSGCNIEFAWEDELPDMAFDGHTYLEEVTIPKSIKAINVYAFDGNVNLTSIKYQGTLEGWEDILIVNNGLIIKNNKLVISCIESNDILLLDVDENMWRYNKESGILEGYQYTFENLSEYSFKGREEFTKVVLRDITLLSRSSFEGCRNLSKVVISKNCTVFPNVFKDCPLLKTAGPIGGDYNIEYGWNEYIPDEGFRGNNYLESIVVPPTVTEFQSHAFEDCSALKHITFPENLTSIGKNVFKGCNSLRTMGPSGTECDIELGNITYIGEELCASCEGLTSVVLPDSVNGIGGSAFKGCLTLNKVIIPNTVKGMNQGIFADCPLLKTAGPIGSDCNIEFGWDTEIPGDAFFGANYLESVTLPDTIIKIMNNAFRNCSSLTKLNIPATVDEGWEFTYAGCTKLLTAGPTGGGYNIEFGWTELIPEYIFHGANCLEEVTLPDTIERINRLAFVSCSALRKINIPSSLKVVDSTAFNEYNSLTTAGPKGGGYCIEFDSLSDLPGDMFQKFKNLESVTLPEDITRVPEAIFRGCTKLINITLIEGIESIGFEAFSGCRALRTITIPESCTSIEHSVFQNCTSLAHVIIPNNTRELGSRIFSGCELLRNAGPIGSDCDIEFGWEGSIPYYAFENCNVTTVTIPDTITEIEACAFSRCNLTEIHIPRSIETIHKQSFDNTDVETIYYDGSSAMWKKIVPDILVVFPSNPEIIYGIITFDKEIEVLNTKVDIYITLRSEVHFPE